jgi:hypothetical protein
MPHAVFPGMPYGRGLVANYQIAAGVERVAQRPRGIDAHGAFLGRNGGFAGAAVEVTCRQPRAK